MSLLGALNTSISGLTSQSANFGNISQDIANSQTVGYKNVGTNFQDYITTSDATENQPGAVVALPDYQNTLQGTITQSSNPLNLAISGNGFFSVSQASSVSSTNVPTFSTQQYYTRAGDFNMNADGYLVNSSGEYLNGWTVGTNGVINKNNSAPIQISQTADQPVPTSNVVLSANLPPAGSTATGSATQLPITSDVSVYDSEGNAHQLTLSFTSAGADSNNWSMTVTDDSGNTIGSGTLSFGPDGTLSSLTQNGTTVNTSGDPAVLALATNYPEDGGTTQNISLNLGDIGSTTGLTQFAASSYTLNGLTQDGVPPGSFSSVTMESSGLVVVNYNNGQSRTVAQVPLATFAAPDSLQRQDGASFTATQDSGPALVQSAGSNGAGTLVANSVEESNVDIATQFSDLIVAQQAYSANAKMVTTMAQMLQVTIDMKQ